MEQELLYYKINICFWQVSGAILYLNHNKRKEVITYIVYNENKRNGA